MRSRNTAATQVLALQRVTRIARPPRGRKRVGLKKAKDGSAFGATQCRGNDNRTFNMRRACAREQSCLCRIEIAHSADASERHASQHFDAAQPGVVLINEYGGLEAQAALSADLQPARSRTLNQVVCVIQPVALGFFDFSRGDFVGVEGSWIAWPAGTRRD